MENNEELTKELEQETETKPAYTPRPLWQVWAARIGLVLFLIFVAYQILAIARGGL